MVKGMGSGAAQEEVEQEEVPSHAFHLVKLAQEKAELMEESEVLAKKLEKEEQEMMELKAAMALLKNSNSKFRNENFNQNKRQMEDTEEVRELKEKVRGKNEVIEDLKGQIEKMDQEIKDKELGIVKLESDLDLVQDVYQERTESLALVEKEVKEQSSKLKRAEKVCSNMGSNLKSTTPNGDIYEQDMDMRAEKEKQRGALIKLRELALVDEKFGHHCQGVIERLGLVVPTMSRLEIQTLSRARRSHSVTSHLSSAGSNQLYRRSHRRSSSSSGGTKRVNSSMIVMEVTRTGANNGVARVPTLPAVR